MADMLFLQAGSPDLSRYSQAMRALIDAEACKLGVGNPGVYFAPGNDYVLAREGERLVGLCVIKRSELKHATYLGYVLVIVRPEARRGGLMGRMLLLYLLRSLPRLFLACLKNPRHRVYLYGDVGSPIVYNKICQLKVPFYPDLRSGPTSAEIALGARLRQELVESCDIRNMWHRPGLVRDVDYRTGIIRDRGETAPKGDAGQRELIHDRDWKIRWHDYVPPQADLLVVIPLQPMTVVRKMASFLALGRRRTTRVPSKAANAALAGPL